VISKTLLFDVESTPLIKKLVKPIEEQEEWESRRLWKQVTAAIRKLDHAAAVVEMSKLYSHIRSKSKGSEVNSGAGGSPKHIDSLPRFFERKPGESRSFRLKRDQLHPDRPQPDRSDPQYEQKTLSRKEVPEEAQSDFDAEDQ